MYCCYAILTAKRKGCFCCDNCSFPSLLLSVSLYQAGNSISLCIISQFASSPHTISKWVQHSRNSLLGFICINPKQIQKKWLLNICFYPFQGVNDREKLDTERWRKREKRLRKETGTEKACCFFTPIHLSGLLYCLHGEFKCSVSMTTVLWTKTSAVCDSCKDFVHVVWTAIALTEFRAVGEILRIIFHLKFKSEKFKMRFFLKKTKSFKDRLDFVHHGIICTTMQSPPNFHYYNNNNNTLFTMFNLCLFVIGICNTAILL